MAESSSQSNPASGSSAEKEHRFVVQSVEEAVKRIRQELGAEAVVTRVNHLPPLPSGKNRGAARLEIFARLPSGEDGSAVSADTDQEDETEETVETSGDEDQSESDGPSDQVEQAGGDEELNPAEALLREEEISGEPMVQKVERSEHNEGGSPAPETRSRPAAPPRAAPASGAVRLRQLLERGGLPPTVLARFEGDPVWNTIAQLPLHQAIPQTLRLLHRIFSEKQRRAGSNRTVFLGTPGTGKTTLLSKYVSRDVLTLERRPQVVRAELDGPNFAEGLQLQCELLRVPCFRSPEDLWDYGANEPVYWDLPGITLRGETDFSAWSDWLDEQRIDTRIFVLHAGYEESLLKRSLQVATRLGATHLAFTHLDEVERWGKLWYFVMHPGFSISPSSRGADFNQGLIPDFWESLIQNSFPGTAPFQD